MLIDRSIFVLHHMSVVKCIQ